jgi:hypothetical protein
VFRFWFVGLNEWDRRIAGIETLAVDLFSLGAWRRKHRQYIFYLFDTLILYLIHSTHGGHENLSLFHFSFYLCWLGSLAHGFLSAPSIRPRSILPIVSPSQ